MNPTAIISRYKSLAGIEDDARRAGRLHYDEYWVAHCKWYSRVARRLGGSADCNTLIKHLQEIEDESAREAERAETSA